LYAAAVLAAHIALTASCADEVQAVQRIDSADELEQLLLAWSDVCTAIREHRQPAAIARTSGIVGPMALGELKWFRVLMDLAVDGLSDGRADAVHIQIYKHEKKWLAKLYGVRVAELEMGGRNIRQKTAIDIATAVRDDSSEWVFDLFSRDIHDFAIGAPVDGMRLVLEPPIQKVSSWGQVRFHLSLENVEKSGEIPFFAEPIVRFGETAYLGLRDPSSEKCQQFADVREDAELVSSPLRNLWLEELGVIQAVPIAAGMRRSIKQNWVASPTPVAGAPSGRLRVFVVYDPNIAGDFYKQGTHSWAHRVASNEVVVEVMGRDTLQRVDR
jgi:hypothetical protein